MACFVLIKPFYPLFDREPLCGVSLDRVMQRNLNEFDMVCALWSSPLVSDGKEQNFFRILRLTMNSMCIDFHYSLAEREVSYRPWDELRN